MPLELPDEMPTFTTIERTIVDFFDAAGWAAEYTDSEWTIAAIDSGGGRISLTAAASAIDAALLKR